MGVPTDAIVKALVQYRAQLIGFAWIIVGDPQQAEDVYQDVSLAVVKKAESIHDEEHLLHWLRHAIRLRALEVRRNTQGRARLLKPEVLDLIEQAHSEHDTGRQEDRIEALHQCISSLQEKPRLLLEMRYAQGMKPAKIAQETGRSLPAIYKAITRVHAALRHCVKGRLARMEAH